MAPRIVILSAALLGVVTAAAAPARTFAGARGGTGSTSIIRTGNSVSGTASGTTARGRSATASGSATYHPLSDTVTGSGSVTTGNGASYGGEVSAGNGSGTATGNNGATVSWTRPQ
jgi:hypothetical protein